MLLFFLKTIPLNHLPRAMTTDLSPFPLLHPLLSQLLYQRKSSSSNSPPKRVGSQQLTHCTVWSPATAYWLNLHPSTDHYNPITYHKQSTSHHRHTHVFILSTTFHRSATEWSSVPLSTTNSISGPSPACPIKSQTYFSGRSNLAKASMIMIAVWQDRSWRGEPVKTLKKQSMSTI